MTLTTSGSRSTAAQARTRPATTPGGGWRGTARCVLEAGRNDVAAGHDAVGPHVHVVAYDRAGLGGSAPSAGPVVLAGQVRDLESVITSAAAGSCVLAGHSWGGILVQLLAWHRPELVAGLVLVDPAHEQMTGGLPRLARRALRLARAGQPLASSGCVTARSSATTTIWTRSPSPACSAAPENSPPPSAPPDRPPFRGWSLHVSTARHLASRTGTCPNRSPPASAPTHSIRAITD
jgi:pimeloyl-ACP methyl ester carboxylesterase